MSRKSGFLYTVDGSTAIMRDSSEVSILTDPVEALRRAERLLEISVTLNAARDPDELLAFIIDMATDVLDCEAASLLLYDAERQVLCFCAATGSNTEQLKDIPVPLQDSLAGVIFCEDRPLVIDDVASDPRHYVQVGEQVQFQTRSLLGVPMHIEGCVSGVLEALNKRSGLFTESDVHLLSIIAAQAAIALRNAQQVQAL